MRNPPVHWHEGLFLRPHHFQAADRYWNETISTGHRWSLPYHYGLHTLELSEDALGNHQFEVHTLRARMRDGTLIDLGQGQVPDPVNLKAAFEQESVVDVYLATPRISMGTANVANADVPGDAPFVSSVLGVDEESLGGNVQEIEFRRPNVRLLLSTADSSGYETLPIARVRRSSEGEAKPQIDADYIPPCIAINAWPTLLRDYVRGCYHVIGDRIDVLSQQVTNRGIGLDSRDPGDAERILMLAELNSAYTTLGVLAFAEGVHPFTAYTELCRAVGQLSVFTKERRPPEIPPYDHEDLARIFRRARKQIEHMIDAVAPYTFQQRFFTGSGLGKMSVSLEPQWFTADWKWYIGVRRGDLSTLDCQALLSKLDWKFGSSRQVDTIFKGRAEGLKLKPIDRELRALPSRQDWLYYDVSQRDNSAWRDVLDTNSLAMRVSDTLVENQDRLQGERSLIILTDGKKSTLQFALFAVPEQT